MVSKLLKDAVDSGLNAVGWQLTRAATDPTYVPCPPNRYPTYSPSQEPAFLAEYAKFAEYTLVQPDRAWNLHQAVHQALQLEGEFVEAGVFRGGTAWYIAELIKRSGQERRLSLFDSFEGMPDDTEKGRDGHDPGDFGNTSLEHVQGLVADYANVDFYPGFIPDTLPPVADRQFAFAHIDVDIYKAVKDCCAFFFPRLVPGGVMLFDDYGFEIYKDAARRAVDEYFATQKESVFALRTGQAMVIKLP